MADPHHPIPTALKVLRGNPGKRPLNDREPKPKRILPRAPAYLNAEAKREWRRMGGRLYNIGLVTEIDETALAAYCAAWARWVEAERQLQKFGTVIKMGTTLIPSPYLSVANKAMAQMVKLLAEFGMTPSSRSRVKVEAEAEQEPLEALRNRGNRTS